MKNLIFSANLHGYRPVMWYGDAVYRRATQIRTLLQERLGNEFSGLLSEPFIQESTPDTIEPAESRWFSDYITAGIPLPTLPADRQAQVLQELDRRLARIRALADELQQDPDPKTRQLAELLLKAIEIPGPQCILVQEQKIVLVMWSFDSDEARRTNFQLHKFIEKNLAPVAPAPQDAPSGALPLVEYPAPPAEQIPVSTGAPPTPPVPPPAKDKKTGRRRWWWLLLLLLLLLALGFWWLNSRETPIEHSPYLPPKPGVIPPIDTAMIRPAPDDSLGTPIIINRLNILLKVGASIDDFAKEFKQQYPDSLVFFVAYQEELNLLQLQFPEEQRSLWRERLEAMPKVSVVFDETILHSKKKPTDPAFSDAVQTWYFDAIQAYQAWNYTEGDSTVIVAVLDDGFDLDHPELANRSIGDRFNVIRNDHQLQPVSSGTGPGLSPHGTHVAATAIGTVDNNSGSGGIAPACRLLPIQIGGPDGSISGLAGIFGIQYAMLHKARVINMSFGQLMDPEVAERLSRLDPTAQRTYFQSFVQNTRSYQERLKVYKRIFEDAHQNGIVLVKAAGNEGIMAEFDPMAATPYTINVAALSQDNNKAPFSNFSSTNCVSAPGVHIYNAIPGKNYDYLDGTSMAAPIVTGAVALLLSVKPDLTPDAIRDLLISTGRPVPATPFPVGPLIQLGNALKSIGAPLRAQDPCEQLIDSLQRVIERLKSVGSAPPAKDPMVIPCNPTDLRFAIGHWRASNDIINIRTHERLRLFFHIQNDGNGRLIIEEPSGNVCSAPVKLEISGDRILMTQTERAFCSTSTGTYKPYNFQFISKCGEEANCRAQAQDGSVSLTFKLYKE